MVVVGNITFLQLRKVLPDGVIEDESAGPSYPPILPDYDFPLIGAPKPWKLIFSNGFTLGFSAHLVRSGTVMLNLPASEADLPASIASQGGTLKSEVSYGLGWVGTFAARQRQSSRYASIRSHGGMTIPKIKDGGVTANHSAGGAEPFIKKRVMVGGDSTKPKITLDAGGRDF